jgi:signal transduction histidine kinase
MKASVWSSLCGTSSALLAFWKAQLAGAERNGRLGLIGIRERAETLGGTLSVESSEGTGTTVLVEAPDGG